MPTFVSRFAYNLSFTEKGIYKTIRFSRAFQNIEFSIVLLFCRLFIVYIEFEFLTKNPSCISFVSPKAVSVLI